MRPYTLGNESINPKDLLCQPRILQPLNGDAKTKLAAIIQTAAMNEVERAEYCRQNGLYVEQLDA